MSTNNAHSSVANVNGEFYVALRRYPDYRLYWVGALLSNIGTWIQIVAQGWLVYQLTGSAFYLGAVGFVNGISSVFVSPVGGVFADRFERRRLMMLIQSGSMLLAFALAALTLSHVVQIWHILVIAFLNGATFALTQPVRHTIISDLVKKEDLMSAISFNAAQFHASRMMGPAVAGVIVAVFGPGWCFLINGLSFLAFIGAVAVMKLPPLKPGRQKDSFSSNLFEGVRYIRSEVTIFSLLALAAIPAIFALPYQALMPAFASSVLGTGAEGLGMLMSATGLGAVIGSLGVGVLGTRLPRGQVMLVAVALLGLSLAFFAESGSFALSMALLVCVGIASMAFTVLNQTFLQTLSDDLMRGRVMSVLMITTFGLQPLGQFMSGTIAAYFGPAIPVLLGGLICALFALLTLARYPQLGRLA